jgi:hypothetical protein
VSSRIGELARKATAAQVELVLPSNPRGPVGSPELHPYATATEPGDDVASMPWTVPAVEFDVEFALPVLGALGGSGLDIDFDDEAKQDNPRIVPLGRLRTLSRGGGIPRHRDGSARQGATCGRRRPGQQSR